MIIKCTFVFTRSKKLKCNKIPCQAVYNQLHIPEIPDELNHLNKLETVLISKRILFKKIGAKGKCQKLKVLFAIFQFQLMKLF